ncbi:Tfp pilus assembly protein PilF [Catalinimonas alkaloidigena]|uniref:tetratricopeptide repeat protein n=1 Tax=Catalinimonas alkaloidigena TaxID=1075417 RepID=UPI0024056AE2|nr:hypothetical protein [Catalinimonas alkaloidigena]MDF9798029.1 Tfp pilus assembly protein PilF [Catalinimonas alkaloidigena]
MVNFTQQSFVVLLLSIFIGFFTTSFAVGQVSMLDRAYVKLKEQQLQESRQAIDMAAEHPSTSGDARMWYLRSFIYKELASHEKNINPQKEFLNVSLSSAFECLAIDTAGQYTKACQAILKHNYTAYLNQAISFLNNKDYQQVRSTLKHILENENQYSIFFLPDALFYNGYALFQEGKQREARNFFFKALQYGYQDPLIYEIEVIYRMNDSQIDSAHWYLDKGRKFFPGDENLQITELNFLMKTEKYELAQLAVEQFLDQHPQHIETLLMAGTIYEKLQLTSDNDEQYFTNQVSVYERILKINEDHLQANYNLGIAYYNRAVRLINHAAQNYDIDILAFNQLLEKCSALFLEALPYMEKVSKLDNTHVNALKALEGIYYNINDYERYNFVKIRLQEL